MKYCNIGQHHSEMFFLQHHTGKKQTQCFVAYEITQAWKITTQQLQLSLKEGPKVFTLINVDVPHGKMQ